MSSPNATTPEITSEPVSSTTQALLSVQCQPGDRLEYLETVQERVRALQNEIRLLNERHNQLAPANCLPVEILSEFFQTYREIVREQSIWTPKSIGRTSWIRFSHVSQRWRAVALDCKAVWTDLMFNAKPEFTQLMLDRSENAKVRVNFDRGNPGHNDMVVKALSHPYGLRDLTVFCDNRNKFDVSPCLAEVSLTSHSLRTLHLESMGGRPIKLPSNFTFGGAQVLTNLTLIEVDFQWNNIPLGQALQSLHLIRPRILAHLMHTATWEEIHDALALAPNLSSFHFEFLLPITRLPEDIATRPVKMEHLETIFIEDTTFAMGEFFLMIQAPVSASVHLAFADCDADAIERCIANLQDLSKDKSSQMKHFGIRKIELSSAAHGEIEVEFFQPTTPEAESLKEPTLRFWFRDIDDDLTKAFMAAMKAHLGLGALSRLSLSRSWIPLSVLIDSLSELPALKSISTKDRLEEMVSLLAQDPAQGVDEDSVDAKPYFPALRTLKFYYNPEIEADIDHLISALKCRPPSRRITKMVFSRSWLQTPAQYKALRAAFPDMEISWDGKMEDMTDEGEKENGVEASINESA